MAETTQLQLHNKLLDSLRGKQVLADPNLEAAFAGIPRHVFLPQIDPANVYQDQAIALKISPSGEVLSSSSQPTMMAIMLAQLQLEQGMNVMEIGTASGYNAALIRHVVGNRGHVTSLEIDRELAEQARDNLAQMGHGDVLVVDGDAIGGYEPRAQYDRILATAGVWDIPRHWLQQLRDDGRLVAPIWLDGVQVSASFVAQGDGAYLSVDNRPCAFVYLQGHAAGPRLRKKVGSTSLVVLADDVEKVDTAALHLLLSEETEWHRLGRHLRPEDFWFGLQLYLMLHEPERYVFAVYDIPPGERAYGLEGNGVVLFGQASAAFAGYNDGGAVHCFGGAAAFLKMQSLFESWWRQRGRLVDRLRLRLIPLSLGEPPISNGKLFKRKEHFLHVWLD